VENGGTQCVLGGVRTGHTFSTFTHLAFPCAAVTFQFRPHPSYIHFTAASQGYFGRGNGTVAGSQRTRNQQNRHLKQKKDVAKLDGIQQHPKS
jgi:hypothetical protein